MEENSLIKSVNPTFFLKKVNYDIIVTNYNSGKYFNIPTLTHKPNISAFIGKPLKIDNRPVGFEIVIKDTIIIVKGKETRYNICANCKLDINGFCSIGIPINMSKTTTVMNQANYNLIHFETKGETCSTECSLSFYKRIGNHKMNLSGRYMDSETLLKLIHYLLFGESHLYEAADITTLIPYGSTSINDYRKKLHMIPELAELKIIDLIDTSDKSKTPKITIKNK
jgi:hypothetical protein